MWSISPPIHAVKHQNGTGEKGPWKNSLPKTNIRKIEIRKIIWTIHLHNFGFEMSNFPGCTLPKFNIAPEKLPSQKETSHLTIHFQGLC